MRVQVLPWVPVSIGGIGLKVERLSYKEEAAERYRHPLPYSTGGCRSKGGRGRAMPKNPERYRAAVPFSKREVFPQRSSKPMT